MDINLKTKDLTSIAIMRLIITGETSKDKTEDLFFLKKLLGVLDSLTPLEKEVLRLRFNLDNPNAYDVTSYTEVAQSLNLTVARIEQVEKKALRKLRHPSRVNKLL